MPGGAGRVVERESVMVERSGRAPFGWLQIGFLVLALAGLSACGSNVEQRAATGGLGGAATGAMVGGPVGAVVGGAIGAGTGALLEEGIDETVQGQ
jgi:hypothetical protein